MSPRGWSPARPAAEHQVRRPDPALAAADQTVALGDPAKEGEHRASMVSSAVVSGQHVWGVRDDHAPRAPARLEVDVVDADRVVRDDAQLRLRLRRDRRRRPVTAGVTTTPSASLGRVDELEVGSASSCSISAGTPAASWTRGRDTAPTRRARAGRARTSRRPCAGSGRSRTGTRRSRPTRPAVRHGSSPWLSTR